MVKRCLDLGAKIFVCVTSNIWMLIRRTKYELILKLTA